MCSLIDSNNVFQDFWRVNNLQFVRPVVGHTLPLWSMHKHIRCV